MGQVLSCSCYNYKNNRLPAPLSNDKENKLWTGLPDLVLYTIIMKLSDIPTYMACGRTCRAWRSVYKKAMSDYMASRPPLLMLLRRIDYPRISSNWHFIRHFLEVSTLRMLKEQRPSKSDPSRLRRNPYQHDLVHSALYVSRRPDQYLLTSNKNYFLGTSKIPVHGDADMIPYITYKQTGTSVAIHDLPMIPAPASGIHNYATGILWAPPASNECRLILFYSFVGAFHIRIKKGDDPGAAEWTHHPYPDGIEFIDGAIVIKDTMYVNSLKNPRLLFMELAGPGRPSEMNFFNDVHLDAELPPRSLGEWDGDLMVFTDRGPKNRERFCLRRLQSSLTNKEWVWMKNLCGRSLFISDLICEAVDVGGETTEEGLQRERIYYPGDITGYREIYAAYSFPDGKLVAPVRPLVHGVEGHATAIWFYPKPSMITGHLI